ncbi:MAG: FG-GAP repeat protein [Ferruginibacter sp.]|nr:FG-GAP repeat protein [Chitinophagaceae bacterium]
MAKLFFTLLFVVAAVFLQAQNVGIGNTNPTEKLEVTGNVKADTVKPAALKLANNAGNGKILTSDASGNATWQANGNSGFGVWGDCATNGNISEYNPVAPDDGATGDWFGFSVAIDGNNAIVGAKQDDVGAISNQGSVSFHRYDGSNWILQQKVVGPAGVTSENFGQSVSIDGNWAVVGAPGDAGGSASIYQYNGSTWVFMQKITDPGFVIGDRFGSAVSISGNYIIVGAENDQVGTNVDQGSACIFRYNVTGNNWIFMQKITDATGSATAEFGCTVSIDGTYAIVGARWENVGTNIDQGTASIYRYNGSSWVLMNKLIDATGESGDQFGVCVSISGNYAVIGASADDVLFNSQGSASIYYYNGSNWVFMQKLSDPNGSASDVFGSSVFVSGNYIIIGAIQDDIGANTNQGSASIYVRVGNYWQLIQFFTDPVGVANDDFGRSVAIDATTKRFVVGAYFAVPGGKAVFGKLN